MTDTPGPGWLPDPHGGDFNRWWDGKHFTKRVQGEPPAGPPQKKPVPVVDEPVDEDEEEDDETDAAAPSLDWPLPSVVAAVISGVGILSAFLLPLGRLPLVIAALGVVVSVITLVLAISAGERRIVAVWGLALGLVGVAVGITISMMG